MGVESYVLPNGIEWVADHNESENGFYIYCTARMGREKERKHEVEGLHLLEHMLFRRRSLAETIEHVEDLEDLRIRSNGATGRASMHCFYHSPTAHWKHAIDTIYQATRNTSFDHNELELEKRIILQERRKLQSEDIQEMLREHLFAEIYHGSHYAVTTQQIIDHIPRLSATGLMDLHRRIMRPENLTVITIGSVDPSLIDTHLDRTFGKLRQRGKPLEPYQPPFPPKDGVRLTLTRPGIALAYGQYIGRAGKSDAYDLATLRVLCSILSGGDASELYKGIRLTKGQGYVPNADADTELRPEMLLQIDYECDTCFVDDNARIVQDAMDRLAQTQVTERVLDRNKRMVAFDIADDIENPEERGDWYVDTVADGLVDPKTQKVFTMRGLQRLVRDVTRKDVRDLAQRILPTLSYAALYPSGDAAIRRLPDGTAPAVPVAAASSPPQVPPQ